MKIVTTTLILIAATTGCAVETASSEQGPAGLAAAPPATTTPPATVTGTTPPAAVAPLGEVLQIAAGARHTCAVHSSGAVTCWGDNGAGQLGVSQETSRISRRPARVPGLGHVSHIAAGGDFTCAQMIDGAVSCWGANTDGQLGRGFADEDAHAETGTAAPSASAGRISLGGAHACVGSDEATMCWGSSAFGETGSRDGALDALAPVRLTALAAPKDLATGNGHSCALLSDGGVYCWGDGTLGQLGIGIDSVVTPLPFGVALPRRGKIVRVAAGGEHTCALDDTGVIMCWGRSDSGQVGYKSKLSHGATPGHVIAPVVAFVNNEPLADIVAGGNFTCAMSKGGTVVCFGANSRGQLGAGEIYSFPQPYAVPVASLSSAIAIAAGSEHACAIVRGDGATSVRCWGANDAGQLGIGTTEDSATAQVVSY